MSAGVVIALGRRRVIGTSDGRLCLYPRTIQTDAAPSPGRSGGPLISIAGKVAGISTAVGSEDGLGMGIGLAIAIIDVRLVIHRLTEPCRVAHGFLGVGPATVARRLPFPYRVPCGARVMWEPTKEISAGEAWTHADDVIPAFAGAPVRGEV